MLGATIGDLEAGDEFEPVEYELTAFMCSEYAHGVEESCEWFHSSLAPGGRQIRPPTMIHVDKMRILERNCLKEQADERRGGARRARPLRIPRAPAQPGLTSASAWSSAAGSPTST